MLTSAHTHTTCHTHTHHCNPHTASCLRPTRPGVQAQRGLRVPPRAGGSQPVQAAYWHEALKLSDWAAALRLHLLGATVWGLYLPSPHFLDDLYPSAACHPQAPWRVLECAWSPETPSAEPPADRESNPVKAPGRGVPGPGWRLRALRRSLLISVDSYSAASAHVAGPAAPVVPTPPTAAAASSAAHACRPQQERAADRNVRGVCILGIRFRDILLSCVF